MKSNKKILNFFDSARRESENRLALQYKENKTNEAFYTGNKEIAFKDGNLEADKYVYFNHIHPIVNSVSGFIIQHRQKSQCLAKIVEQEEQQFRSQYINSISDTFKENANFDQIESKQDLDMLIYGYGAVDIEILYNNEHGSDPEGNGEIDIERISPNDVWFDVNAQEQNFTDARYVARKKAFEKTDIKRLFGVDPETLEQEEFEYGEKEPVYNDGAYQSKQTMQYVSGTDDEQIVIHQFQWWDYETFYRIENPIFMAQDEEQAKSIILLLASINNQYNEEDEENFEVNLKGNELVLDKKRWSTFKEILTELDIYPEAVKIDRRVYYTAMISGDVLLEKHKNIHQAGFTIKFKTAYFDSERKLLFGLVSLMREPAKYLTKSLTEMMKATETLAQSGVIVEKGVTDDPADFEKRFNEEATVIWINDGMSGRIHDKRQPQMPTGYENILQKSEEAIRKTTNITPELLGNTENKNATATLERQRIKQAMTTLATFFDSILLYQTETMRLMIDYIKIIAENSPNKIVKIIGEDGSVQFAQLMQDMLDCEFQIDIAEAPDSPSQKEENLTMIMSLADKFSQMGMGNIYPIALKYVDGLSEADRQTIIEMITPKPQPPDPLAEEQQRKLIEMMGAEVDKAVAEAMDKQASAIQRQADTNKKLSETALNNEKIKGEKITAMTGLVNMATLPPPPPPPPPPPVQEPTQPEQNIQQGV